MDACYDFVPIYQQLLNMKAYGIIDYNKRNEGELIGFNEHFAPTCVREHSFDT
jgi:transposase